MITVKSSASMEEVKTEYKRFGGSVRCKMVGVNPTTMEDAVRCSGREFVPNYHGTTKDGVDWSRVDYWMESTEEGLSKGKHFCLSFFLSDAWDTTKAGMSFTMDAKGNSRYLSDQEIEDAKKGGEKIRKAYRGEKDFKAFLKTIANLRRDDDLTVNTKAIINGNFVEVEEDAKAIIASGNEVIIFVGFRQREYEKDGVKHVALDTDVYPQVKAIWSKSTWVEDGIERRKEDNLKYGKYYPTTPYGEVSLDFFRSEAEDISDKKPAEAPAQQNNVADELPF